MDLYLIQKETDTQRREREKEWDREWESRQEYLNEAAQEKYDDENSY